MHLVGHDDFGNRAVLVEEATRDIEVADVVAVIKSSEVGIYRADFLHVAFPVIGIAIGVYTWAAREGAEREHFGGGDFLVDEADDFLDTGADFSSRIAAAVVGADKEDDDFGGDAIELALRDTPDDVLGLVAANAEVGGLIGAVIVFPDMRGISPGCCDGVAEKEQADRS